MFDEDDVSWHEPWQQFEADLQARWGHRPTIDEILLRIGIFEAGMPEPTSLTDNERMNILQMAEATILVPGRYYALFWVEDSGWPHYSQLERLPRMNAAQKADFLKPYILYYIEHHRRLKL